MTPQNPTSDIRPQKLFLLDAKTSVGSLRSMAKRTRSVLSASILRLDHIRGEGVDCQDEDIDMGMLGVRAAIVVFYVWAKVMNGVR